MSDWVTQAYLTEEFDQYERASLEDLEIYLKDYVEEDEPEEYDCG